MFSNRHPRRLVGGFQRRYLLTQLAGLVLSLALLTASLFVPSLIGMLDSDSDSRLEAASRFLTLHALAWPLMTFTLLLVAYVMVLNTHRLAGPMYGFRLVFAAVGRGVLTTRASIRRGDYLSTEATELDQMITSLRERIGAAQAELARARGEVIQLARRERLASEADITPLSESIARAQAILDQFETGRSVSGTHEREDTSANEAERSEAVPSGTRGFMIMEILIVTLMIGTIAALAIPGYARALESARVTRALGDIRAIARETKMSFLLDGCYPSSLADIGKDILRDPWGRPYEYGVIGKSGNGGPPVCTACSAACVTVDQARKDRNLNPLNSDFDVYSHGPDGVSVAPVSAPESLDDIVRANDGNFGLGSDY